MIKIINRLCSISTSEVAVITVVVFGVKCFTRVFQPKSMILVKKRAVVTGF